MRQAKQVEFCNKLKGNLLKGFVQAGLIISTLANLKHEKLEHLGFNLRSWEDTLIYLTDGLISQIKDGGLPSTF